MVDKPQRNNEYENIKENINKCLLVRLSVCLSVSLSLALAISEFYRYMFGSLFLSRLITN